MLINIYTADTLKPGKEQTHVHSPLTSTPVLRKSIKVKPAITHSFTSAVHTPSQANTELFTAVLHSGIKMENGILGPQVTQNHALL